MSKRKTNKNHGFSPHSFKLVISRETEEIWLDVSSVRSFVNAGELMLHISRPHMAGVATLASITSGGTGGDIWLSPVLNTESVDDAHVRHVQFTYSGCTPIVELDNDTLDEEEYDLLYAIDAVYLHRVSVSMTTDVPVSEAPTDLAAAINLALHEVKLREKRDREAS